MKINTNNFKMSDNKYETKLYTLPTFATFTDEDDNPRLSIDNDKVFAKAVKNKLSKNFNEPNRVGFSYYIKAQPNRILYNPQEFYSIDSSNKSTFSFINKICKNELVFQEVPESVFNKYINYLRTSNTKWLTDAQREVK